MSEQLARGTPCYLVNLTEMNELVGRVVDVVAGPMFDEGEWRYSIDASWVRQQWPGAPMVLALRHHLQPLVPPRPATLERHTLIASNL